MSSPFNNSLLKITAVLLAVLLWFHVVSKKHYEYGTTLPVTEIDLPSGIGPVSGFPDSLVVKVTAEGKRLLRDDWKKAGLKIKATRLRRGINSLELNLETVSLVQGENVTLLELPGAGAITIQLDRLDTLQVPIASRITAASNGSTMYVADRVVLTPNRTRVIGPAALLTQIDSIFTEPEVLDNGDSVHNMYVKLEPPTGIRLQDDSVLARVSFERAASRRFEPLPVTMGRNRLGGKAKIEPDRVAVDVQCPEAIIDTISSSGIKVQVNNDGSIREGYLKVEVMFPRRCTLLRVIPDSVYVRITP
ncbi:MAG: hypothetical protein PHR28_11515 [candidate division Zixibacteria bacterium]|nr:hypothetical protein [candidate division Zixibacteria bacterium]